MFFEIGWICWGDVGELYDLLVLEEHRTVGVLASFDAILREHVEKVDESKTMVAV